MEGRSRRAGEFNWVALTVCVIAFVAVMAFLAPLWLPHSGHRHSRAATLSNVKQLALAHIMYATDYDERMAPADDWMDAIYPYTKNEYILRDPDLKSGNKNEYGFAFFKPLSGVDLRRVRMPDTVPLVFQSTLLDRNAAGELDTLPDPPRNGKTNAVSFLDGHAKLFDPSWPTSPVTLVLEPDPSAQVEKE